MVRDSLNWQQARRETFLFPILIFELLLIGRASREKEKRERRKQRKEELKLSRGSSKRAQISNGAEEPVCWRANGIDLI